MKRIFFYLVLFALYLSLASCGGATVNPQTDAAAMIEEMAECIRASDDADQRCDDICKIQVKYAKPYVDSDDKFEKYRDAIDSRTFKHAVRSATEENMNLSKREIQEAFMEGFEKSEDKISWMQDKYQKKH